MFPLVFVSYQGVFVLSIVPVVWVSGGRARVRAGACGTRACLCALARAHLMARSRLGLLGCAQFVREL